jgi:hypothetical protein
MRTTPTPLRLGRALVKPGPPRDGTALARLAPRARVLLVVVALAVAVVVAYAVARWTPLFAITTVDVEGAAPGVEGRVRATLQPLVGSSLVSLERGDVERRLAALPMVGSASYDRAFPHTLRVLVRAERAVAVLRRGADSWLLSARARLLRRLSPGAKRTLPRIWVGPETTVELGETVEGRSVRAAAAAARAARDSGFAKRVATVKSDDAPASHVADEQTDTLAGGPTERGEGGGLVLVLRSGLEVRLGTARRLELKLAVARRILQAARPGPRSYLDVTVPERSVGLLMPQPEG